MLINVSLTFYVLNVLFFFGRFYIYVLYGVLCTVIRIAK